MTELCICSVADLVENAESNTNFEVWRTKQKSSTITSAPDITHAIQIVYEEQDKLSSKGILNKISRKEILRQSTEAVNYLHGIGLIHRNLHPDNFLIAADGDDKFVVKLTDFQLAKDFQKFSMDSASYSWSEWTLVPEMKADNAANKEKFEDYSKWDIFILGCYFYYVLTGGYHPFQGDETRMKDENSDPFKNSWEGKTFWTTKWVLFFKKI